MTRAVQSRRATLFVGALALEGLGAALGSGADLACIDLEDAVPPGRKAEARSALLHAAGQVVVPQGVQLVTRINALTEPDGWEDLRALTDGAPAVGGVMLPKVDDPNELREAGEFLDAAQREVDLYAIIETAQGLEACCRIAQAHPRLKALFFGGFDLSTALGCEMAWEPLLYARSRVVHAGALAGLPVIDSPFPDVADTVGLQADCARVKALGMSGKSAKHASQVATIRQAFTPTPAEQARARAILAMFEADPTRPLVYEGKLVELPSIKRLQRLAGADAKW
ncbi:MAG: Citrate lyase subunit beta [Pseudomonadota bacterium]